MSEQAVDLRSTWAVLRRHSAVLVVAAVLGAAAGVGLLVLVPPPFTSTSVVLLPAASQPGSGRLGGYDAETQVLVVTGSEVLSRAAREVDPPLTLAQATDRVSVEAPTSAVLRITADGPTAAQAERLASAVARSLVAYLEETRGSFRAAVRAELQDRLDTLTASLRAVDAEIKKAQARIATLQDMTAAGPADAAAVSDLTAVRASTVLDVEALKKQLAGEDGTEGAAAAASVMQAASPGERSGYVSDVLLHVAGGALLATLVAAALFVMTNKRDPKLRSRDEIADSVGIPVVASLRARAPRSAGGWMDRLRSYDPDSADGWALRRLLHGLVDHERGERSSAEPSVLVVVSLGGDAAGLAIGPQIASFAASTGVSTELLAVQQHQAATALWAACSQGSSHEDLPHHLRVATGPVTGTSVDLSVRLVVLDRDTPAPDAGAVAGETGLLAVSPAAATRRNMADAVIALDRAGLHVRGIVVANPDPLDRTTGRLGSLELSGEPQRPTRLTARSAAGARAATSRRRLESRGRPR